MSATDKKAIIAYGTEQDRAKLAALAKRDCTSGSSWLIRIIRREYEKMIKDQGDA